MRKNLFVDLHRMGLIIRFDGKRTETDPFSKYGVKYVAMSDQGLKLIRAKNILDQYFIFSKGIDRLLGGFIDVILDILRDKDYGIENISIYEYMFFVSAIGSEFNFSITTDKAVELIKSYRNLTNLQRKSVVETLKADLNPKKFSGKKTLKRDFHNWHNKAIQVYYLLNQTVYFEVRGEQLVLKGGENSYVEAVKRLDRSLNEKYQYFVNHKISKIMGFELHHVVPLAWSENIHHFKILDKWQNMVYIDAFSHAKITQNKNRNIKMDFMGDDMTLTDYASNQVYLRYVENIAYKTSHKNAMGKYNFDLLNTVQ